MPDETGLENMSMHENLPPTAPETPMEIKPIAGGSQEADAQKEPSPQEKLKSLTEVSSAGAEITDKKLLKLASLLTESQSRERLQELKRKGEDWFLEELVPEDQWIKLAPVMEEMISLSVSERAEELRTQREIRNSLKEQESSRKRLTGEEEEEIPEGKEAQRAKFISLVESIEKTEASLSDYKNSNIVARIERAIADVRVLPEVRQECWARLKLHHCAILTASVPTKAQDANTYLQTVFASPESRRYALEGKDIDFLLKDRIPDLKISQAFGLLQEAHVVGLSVNGRVIRFTDEKISSDDKDALENETRKQLGGGEKAEKSLQLARRIAQATLETSIWNRNLAGNDPLAEIIYFRKYRTKRKEKGREDRGPDATIPHIEGFGTSFFRGAHTIEKMQVLDEEQNVPLFLPQPENHLHAISEIENEKEAMEKVLIRNRGEKPGFNENAPEKGKVELLEVKDMDFMKLAPGAYTSWLSGLGRVFVLKDILLQSHWKPDDLDSDDIDKWIGPLDAADPQEALRLKSWLVFGILWSIYSKSDAIDYGWDKFALKAREDNLLRVTERGDKEGSFLSEDQMKWIKNRLKKDYGLNVDRQSVFTGITIWATKRFAGTR